jgi:hypothetical protein
LNNLSKRISINVRGVIKPLEQHKNMNTQEKKQEMVYGSNLITLSDDTKKLVQKAMLNVDCNGDLCQLSPNMYIDGKDAIGDVEWYQEQLICKWYQHNGGGDELDAIEQALDPLKTIKEMDAYVDSNVELSNMVGNTINLAKPKVPLGLYMYGPKMEKTLTTLKEKLGIDCLEPNKVSYAPWSPLSKSKEHCYSYYRDPYTIALSYGDVVFILAYLDILDTLDTKVNSLKDAYTLLDTKLVERDNIFLVLDSTKERDLSYYLRLFLVLESKRLSDIEFKAKYGPTKDQEGVCKIDDGLDLEQFNLDLYALYEGGWIYSELDYNNCLSD